MRCDFRVAHPPSARDIERRRNRGRGGVEERERERERERGRTERRVGVIVMEQDGQKANNC